MNREIYVAFITKKLKEGFELLKEDLIIRFKN